MTSINRRILKIAIPSIVTNITVPLLGLVDVAIVGHLGDASYIGAIAIGSMLFNVIYWIFGFLRMGTSGMVSQAFGRRDLDNVMRLLLRSMSVSLFVSLCLIAFQHPLRLLAFWIMRPSGDMIPLTTSYFDICIWGAPAVLSLYSLTGWFIGMQNTRIPMFVSIFQNIVNIVASLLFVYVFEMKMEGVALGTVIAQHAGAVLALCFFFRYYGRLRIYVKLKGLFEREAFAGFFNTNSDIFLRTLFLVGVNLFFTSAGSRYGATTLAVNTLLMTLYTLFSYIMDGFAYAGEALSGKYYGAGNKVGLRNTVNSLYKWGGVMSLLFTLIYLFGGSAFLSLLTDDANVITASEEYYLWAVAIPVAGVAAFVYDGIYIGMTATRGMLISSCIAGLSFFMVFFMFKNVMQNHALWLAFILFLALRGVVQAVIMKYNRKFVAALEY